MYKNSDRGKALYWHYRARKAGVPGLDERIANFEKKLSPEELARALKLSAGKI